MIWTAVRPVGGVPPTYARCMARARSSSRGRRTVSTGRVASYPCCQLSALSAIRIATRLIPNSGGATVVTACKAGAAPSAWISHTAFPAASAPEIRCASRADRLCTGGMHSCRIHYSPDILVNCRCPLTDGFRSCYCIRMPNLVKLWPAKSCRRANVRCDAVYFSAKGDLG